MNGALAFRAAEIMAERGHCKDTLEDEEGRVCYVGALHAAINELGTQDSYCEITEMSRIILEERGYPARSHRPYTASAAIDYNNDPGTTGEDVIMLLKESGARLEGQ